MITVHDVKYRYVSVFNPADGTGVRSNVYDKHWFDTGKDPFMGSFPELLDVGIMGHCAHGKSGLCLKSGVECYQNGIDVYEENMPFSNFKRVIDECRGRTFQVALGGRGDPDMHEDFLKIIRYAKENNVIPNFTTSGFGLREVLMPDIKKYCGAVAVSWYRNEYTHRAIEMFLSHDIKTNIHYCLSKSTIDEAIKRVENNEFPKGVNRVIFLLHKPVGLGTKENVLSFEDERVRKFFSFFDNADIADKAGFDSCSVPALINYTTKIDSMCMEPCEAGRFSAYISPDFKLYPCSFETDAAFAVPLEGRTIEDAWNSEEFRKFRERFNNGCINCDDYNSCFGGCPVKPDITICKHRKRGWR